MAALLGSNTAVMLVHGLQQEMNPSVTREFALTLIAVTLPFQAVYFMIHTYADSFAQNLAPAERRTLERLSTVCQIIAYASCLAWPSCGATSLHSWAVDSLSPPFAPS